MRVIPLLQSIFCKWYRFNPQNPDLPEHLPVTFDSYAFANPHSNELEFVIATISTDRVNQSIIPIANDHLPQETPAFSSETEYLNMPGDQRQQNITQMNWPLITSTNLPDDSSSIPCVSYSSLMLGSSSANNGYLPNVHSFQSAQIDHRPWLSFPNLDAVGADMASSSGWPEQQQFMH